MGIGFHPEEASTSSSIDLSSTKELIVPKAAYGLSTRQMAALGFTDPEVVQMHNEPDPVCLLPHHLSRLLNYCKLLCLCSGQTFLVFLSDSNHSR